MNPSVPDPSKIVHQAAAGLMSRLHPLDNRPIDDASQREVAEAIDACLTELNSLNLWGLDNRLLSSTLWNAGEPLLSRGWLQNRARTKPRGYAGDYELLAWIYEQRVADDPLGRLMDRYFQAQAAPQAVRNRMAMMADWIAGLVSGTAASNTGPIRIGIVGAALGFELRDAARRLDKQQKRRLTAVLVDMDPDALDFAAQNLNGVLAPNEFETLAANFFRLPQRPTSMAQLTACDLILCPGLFDYLDDQAARDMLGALYARLAPGGRLIVFQFAPHNPTRAYMEWFGNWYLTYRDLEQLESVVARAELMGAEIHFGAEPLGIDLYAAVSRPFGSG
jgi:SAM-dependent methyltransferase